MGNRWIKRIFLIMALSLLALWPVAYAYASSDGRVGQDIVQIGDAEALAAIGTSAGSNMASGQVSQASAQESSQSLSAGLTLDGVIPTTEGVLPSHVYVLNNREIVTEKPSSEIDKLPTTAAEPSSPGEQPSRSAIIRASVKGAASRQIVVDENDRIIEIWSNTDGANGGFYSLRIKEQRVEGLGHSLTRGILTQYNRLLGEVDWSIKGRAYSAEIY